MDTWKRCLFSYEVFTTDGSCEHNRHWGKKFPLLAQYGENPSINKGKIGQGSWGYIFQYTRYVTAESVVTSSSSSVLSGDRGRGTEA